MTECVNRAIAEYACNEKDVLDCGLQTWLYAEATNSSKLLLEREAFDNIVAGNACKNPLDHSSGYAYGRRGTSAAQFRRDQEQLFPFPEFAFCPMPCTETTYTVDQSKTTRLPSATVPGLEALRHGVVGVLVEEAEGADREAVPAQRLAVPVALAAAAFTRAQLGP